MASTISQGYTYVSAYFKPGCLLLCPLRLATELRRGARRGAVQCGDGDVTLVQLSGQLGHLLPHSLHLTAVSLLGPLKLLSELQDQPTQYR